MHYPAYVLVWDGLFDIKDGADAVKICTRALAHQPLCLMDDHLSYALGSTVSRKHTRQSPYFQET